MSATPAKILQRLLVELNQAVDPPQVPWPCYVGILPDGPDDAMVAIDSIGRVVGRDMVDSNFDAFYGVQLMLRSSSPKEGHLKAIAIIGALTRVRQMLVSVDSARYNVWSVRPVTPVVRLGQEGSTARYLFNVQFELSVMEV